MERTQDEGVEGLGASLGPPPWSLGQINPRSCPGLCFSPCKTQVSDGVVFQVHSDSSMIMTKKCL